MSSGEEETTSISSVKVEDDGDGSEVDPSWESPILLEGLAVDGLRCLFLAVTAAISLGVPSVVVADTDVCSTFGSGVTSFRAGSGTAGIKSVAAIVRPDDGDDDDEEEEAC